MTFTRITVNPHQMGDALTTLFSGWSETLLLIVAAGIGTAVVSNKGVAAVQSTLERFGIADLIELVVGDQPGMPRKPDPALFTQVVRRAFPTVGHDRVLIVGDTDADIRFAHNARIRSCWARYGYGNTDACMALAPDFVVSAPGELASIVL